MPTTLSVIPPVVPWTAAAGGAAVRLLQAGHMVVPSAICVPHPLQKAIDLPHTSGLPQMKTGPWAIRSNPNGESYQNQGSKANRIARQIPNRYLPGAGRGVVPACTPSTEQHRPPPSPAPALQLQL